MARLGAILLVGALAGCSAAPRERMSAPRPEEVAPALLNGFDPLEEGRDWRRDDRVLFGIRLESPEEPATDWLVRLSVVETPLVAESADESDAPGVLLVQLEVFDSRGARIGNSLQEVEEAQLRKGFLAGFLQFHDLHREIQSLIRPAEGDVDREELGRIEERFRRLAFGERAVQLAFLKLIALNPETAAIRDEIVKRVVDTPSPLSMLFSPPKSITITYELHRIRVLERQDRQLIRLPFRASLDDHPLLDYAITAAPSRPPLQLAAGVVALEARHPTDPKRRFSILLLAARRGPA